MSEIENALQPVDQHDACEDCGKRTDGLMTCTYSHDGSTTKLCPDCMQDSGFCLGCGNYCAGVQSFDFSDMPGYCSDCRDEIKSNFGEFDDDDDWSDDDPDDDDDPDNTTFTIDPELLDDFINNYHPVDEKKSVLDQGLPKRF